MSRCLGIQVALAIWFATALVASAQEKGKAAREYPPTLDGAKVEVYKTIGDVKLYIYS